MSVKEENVAEEVRLLDEDGIVRVFELFKKNNPSPASELIAPNPYCLLVSVVLSAQATDKSVNLATKPLFERVTTPEQMLALGSERLMAYIKSIGLYRTKAAHVMELSRILAERFNSSVPDNMEDLCSLPGVGRKTANVILNVVYNKPVMPVDTHIMRISPRIGLAAGSTPLQIEEGLVKNIPSRYMNHAHHWLILHGRYVCTARSPKCGECIISAICLKNGI